MGHLVANEPWAAVDIDTNTGRVFVQQDWLYAWQVWPGATPWTHPQKVAFHSAMDRGIWGVWSTRLFLNVTGRAPFAPRRVPVTFDVRWRVAGAHHYRVTAWKVPPGSTPDSPVRSNVDFTNRLIELSSADTGPSSAANDAGQSTTRFLMSPHEFGHTMAAPDEYQAATPGAPNPHLPDTQSVMNIGRRVRPRHLQLLTESLHRLIPGATFSA